MCLSEYLSALKTRGIKVTPARVRYAIQQEKLPQPRLDASHRFDFTEHDVDRAAEFFGASVREAVSCS